MRWYLVYGQPGINRIATDRFEDRETAIARACELYAAGVEIFCLAPVGAGETDVIEGADIGILCGHASQQA
jgi:hypothetical protein